MFIEPVEIEEQLNNFIKKHHVEKKLSVSDVKRWIYEADDEDVMLASNKFQKKFMRPFSRVSEKDFQEVIDLAMHSWNVFPHKSLNGLSPQEKVQEVYGDRSSEITEQEPIDPIMNIGPHKIPFSEFQKFAAEMEKVQEPFRQWTEDELLPAYKKFLGMSYKSKTVEKYYGVAEIFLQKSLSSGFTNYEEITAQFASWFCDWWPTHVLYSDLNPNQVWRSLVKFFDFVTRMTGMDIGDESENEDKE
jgi:hypothetical protein